MYGENIVAPPGNQAANRENKYSPVIRGPRSTRLSNGIELFPATRPLTRNSWGGYLKPAPLLRDF